MQHSFFQDPIKTRYQFLSREEKILWPIVEAKLAYQKFSLPQTIRTLVDSGASHSLLHPFIAEILGFDFKKLGNAKLSGASASGAYKSWLLPKPITIDIAGYQFQRKFIVIDNPKLIWGCILGGDSIFEVAKLNFVKFERYFEIQFRKDLD